MAGGSNTVVNPRVPRRIRLVNAIGRRLRAWGIQRPPMTEEAVIENARRWTRLDDFGTQRFREPLRALLESYREDHNLTFVGRIIAQRLLIGLLANRLRIWRDLTETPSITSREIRRPLFVIGLPRTGTTLLHNLLSQDPQARPLLFWESMNPSPPPDPKTGGRDPRIKQARRFVSRLNHAIPDLPAIHEMDPHGPNECLGLMMNTFVTPFFRGKVESYLDWLEAAPEEEVVTAYREYRQQLQILQWRTGPCRWALKCPSHLFGLRSLLTVFPDACLVQTHRDLAEAVPSLCSLSVALDGLMYERLDRADVGQRTLRILEDMISRCLKARLLAPAGQVFDLDYRDLVGDPGQSVRRIYEHFGFDYNETMAVRVQTYLAAHPRQEHGMHRYSLDDFSLDRAAIRERFAAYYERFSILART
jgi:Sulfotransferase family